jgi:hypothetical protein
MTSMTCGGSNHVAKPSASAVSAQPHAIWQRISVSACRTHHATTKMRWSSGFVTMAGETATNSHECEIIHTTSRLYQAEAPRNREDGENHMPTTAFHDHRPVTVHGACPDGTTSCIEYENGEHAHVATAELSADVRYPDVHVQLTERDGNAFAILAAVTSALRSQAHVDKTVTDAFFAEATKGDYDHLLATCMAWVDVS